MGGFRSQVCKWHMPHIHSHSLVRTVTVTWESLGARKERECCTSVCLGRRKNGCCINNCLVFATVGFQISCITGAKCVYDFLCEHLFRKSY
jgi:hypothetical protein